MPIKQTAIQKEIARRNKLWKAATPAQKRVLVARDVLEQLASKKYTAEAGCYSRINASMRRANVGLKDVRRVVLKPDTVCQCCAVGGLFLSTVLFTNSISANFISKSDTDSRALLAHPTCHAGGSVVTDVFSDQQLTSMEHSFEGWDKYGTPSKAFYLKHPDEHKRLVAIMKNLILNNGTFKL